MAFDPVSAVADLIKTGLDKWLPDANQKEQLKAEIDKAQLSGDLAVMMKNLEINLEEAKSTSLLIAGWRPAVGWICVCGLAIEYLLFPVVALFGAKLPPVDFATLMGLLIPILGVGTMRTVEKVQDAEGNR